MREEPRKYYSGDTIVESYLIPDDATNVRLIINSKEGCYVKYVISNGDEVKVGPVKSTDKTNCTIDEEL